jgi:hypothetical protein
VNKCLCLVALIALAIAGPAMAHDAYIGAPGSEIEFATWASQSFNHQDAAPFKGWAYVFVKNTSLNPWGDFHFRVFSYDGSDVSAVDFRDASMGGMDPISTQIGTTWSIDNSGPQAIMSLYFYGDPVQPGEFAAFQVYTDNTTTQGNFGLCIWPSPVPEPSSLLALSGMFGLAGLVWRKRR